jgi:hypothetical protein
MIVVQSMSPTLSLFLLLLPQRLPYPTQTTTKLTTTRSALYWPPEPNAFAPSEPEAPEDTRKRELIYSDPVHRLNLVAFVREHLQAAVQSAGGEARFHEEWLARVDKDVVKGFGELGIM